MTITELKEFDLSPQEALAYSYKLADSLQNGDEIALLDNNSYSTSSLVQMIIFMIRYVRNNWGYVTYENKMQKLNYTGNLLIYDRGKIKPLPNSNKTLPDLTLDFVLYPDYVSYIQRYFDLLSSTTKIEFPKVELREYSKNGITQYSIWHPSFKYVSTKVISDISS